MRGDQRNRDREEMKLFLYLALGYTDIRMAQEAVKEFLNLANRCGCPLLNMRMQENTAVVRVYMRDEKKILSCLQSCGIKAEVLRRRGLPALWNRYCHRIGILGGCILFFLVLNIAPLFVWEINVTGLEKLSREYVMELLEQEGVYIGAFSPSIDRRAVYTNILRASEDISWLSVNIRGSSANVEIVEREYTPVTKRMADAANIIADKDGVIVDAEVKNGRLSVQKGEVVQKGALLVSGVYDTKKMGTRYVYADAAVYAVVSDEYCIQIPLENTKRVYGEETVQQMSLKMFGKNINIFKNYSIFEENYDTIQREDNLPLVGFDKLPFSIETICALPYTDVPVLLTEQAALERAKQELWRRLDEEAEYLETLAFEESYTVENAVLIYRCSVEAIENIAAVSEFSLNE